MESLLRFLLQPTTLFLVLYPLLDFIVPLYPPLGLVGYGWILIVYLLVFGVAVRSFSSLFSRAREEGQWWTVASVVVWWLFIVGAAIPERLLSDENLFEFGCPLIRFREESDFGFRNQCFIGYPNRSFLLQALSVGLFGFSPFIANIGASVLLFPGIALLAQAIRIVTERARASDFITGLSILFLFQCSMLIRVIYYHDQTSHPVAITMIFIGLIALWLERSDRLAFVALLALFLVATAMYPPILSVLGLLGVVLLWAVLRKRLPKGSPGLLLLTGGLAIVSFAQTLAYRLDLRLGVEPHNVERLSGRLGELGSYITTQSNGVPYAAVPFRGLFVGFLACALLGRFGRFALVVAAWSVAVICVSFFSGGMSPELTWYFMTGMHRALPVFPFFILLISMLFARRIEPYRLSKTAMAILLLCVIVPAGWTMYRLPLPKLPPLSYRVWKVAREVTPQGAEPQLTLITRNDLPVLGELPKHYLYLHPKRTFEYYAGTCLPQKPVPPHTLVITIDDEICQRTPARDGFQEVAAWGEYVLGEWKYTPNTVRVYRSTTSVK